MHKAALMDLYWCREPGRGSFRGRVFLCMLTRWPPAMAQEANWARKMAAKCPHLHRQHVQLHYRGYDFAEVQFADKATMEAGGLVTHVVYF